ncbi:hypothetical protein AVEN_119668-1 [Araneus ventricosus]|uniref:Uncharacterized protein n=1 Tax=Araneus ventricosus TaxID=182803 RepID=A0A4Y2ARD9_ARAVE|nr:hypothetical protein AVEN_119668-1 [Araneus ventricosus]
MIPELKFLGYIAPETGTSKCIEHAISDFFLESKTSMESLVAVGCDGTNVSSFLPLAWNVAIFLNRCFCPESVFPRERNGLDSSLPIYKVGREITLRARLLTD